MNFVIKGKFWLAIVFVGGLLLAACGEETGPTAFIPVLGGLQAAPTATDMAVMEQIGPTAVSTMAASTPIPTPTLAAAGSTVVVSRPTTAVSTEPAPTVIDPPTQAAPTLVPTGTAVPASPTDFPTPLPTATPFPTVAVEPSPTATALALAPVFEESYYDVVVQSNVVYGQGLLRSNWSDVGGWPSSLTLDVYQPVISAGLRPAMMLFHGGGFAGGGADYPNMVQTAEYFASRGWVVFSVDYRLRDDYGSVPAGWPQEPGNMLYPAGRDAKAAVRWLHANAAQYNVSTAHITALGGSAGGMLALMLGTSDAADYRDELDVTADSTLATTYLSAPADVQTVVVLWGNDSLLYALEQYDGRSRYDATDAPTLIIHGSEDDTIRVWEAEEMYLDLHNVGVPVEYQLLQGRGHAAWNASWPDGRPLLYGVFDFVVARLGLVVSR